MPWSAANRRRLSALRGRDVPREEPARPRQEPPAPLEISTSTPGTAGASTTSSQLQLDRQQRAGRKDHEAALLPSGIPAAHQPAAPYREAQQGVRRSSGRSGHLPVLPKNPFATKFAASNPYTYNPKRAIALLTSHGWKVDPKNVTTCADAAKCGVPAGTKLQFTLPVRGRLGNHEAVDGG